MLFDSEPEKRQCSVCCMLSEICKKFGILAPDPDSAAIKDGLRKTNSDPRRACNDSVAEVQAHHDEAGHILSRILYCTKPVKRPIDNDATAHFTLNISILQLYTQIVINCTL